MDISNFFARRKSSTTSYQNPEELTTTEKTSFILKPRNKFLRLKSSFYDSEKNRASQIYNSHSWIDERIPEEPLGEFYETRKKIIFNKINIINNENEFAKLLTDSQSKMNKMKTSEIFSMPEEEYYFVIKLKENIANYLLVINAYLILKIRSTAQFIFLQMDKLNRDKIENIYEQIRKNFKNMNNSNKIGKFYPSIIKIFLKLLAVIIKFSVKLNKQFLENYYLKKYLLTIELVKNTISRKFISYNQKPDYYFKNLARFFYFDCLYKQSIYFFMRYQSFDIITELLNYISEKYINMGNSSISNFERILLMKVNYNLGLYYYSMGNSADAILKLDESNDHLKNIYTFPYTILNITQENKSPQSLKNQNIKPLQEKSTLSSFNNIDENIDKMMNNETIKKRAVSTKVKYDNSFAKKEIYFGLKQKIFSVINFGKNKIIILDNERFIENFIREQIYVEINLTLAEIELNRNNKIKAFNYINDILNVNNNISKNINRNSLIDLKINFSLNESKFMKSNKKIELTKSNRSRIFFILNKIDSELDMIHNNKSLNIFNSMKSLEEIKDISYSSLAISKSKYPSCVNFQQKNNFELDNEVKIIQSLEKFFIFIYGLSMYQLKLLNEFQPNINQKRDELPIIFPTQFKDSLNFSQRMFINSLDTMSLSRCIVLLEPKKDITPNNLNYYLLNQKKILRKNSEQLGGGMQPGYGENFSCAKNYLKKIGAHRNKKNKNMSNYKSVSVQSIKSNLNREKNIFKKKLFIQGQFEKFMEEDEHFNEKIDELINNKDKTIINKSQVHKFMNELNSEDKELLMNDESYIEILVNKIKKKVERRNNSCK